MTTQAQQIVTDALRMLGIGGTGTTLDPDDAEVGRRMLNEIVDRWALQPLTQPTLQRTVVPLVAGQAAYTIGDGGDIGITPPLAIRFVTLLYTP